MKRLDATLATILAMGLLAASSVAVTAQQSTPATGWFDVRFLSSAEVWQAIDG